MVTLLKSTLYTEGSMRGWPPTVTGSPGRLMPTSVGSTLAVETSDHRTTFSDSPLSWSLLNMARTGRHSYTVRYWGGTQTLNHSLRVMFLRPILALATSYAVVRWGVGNAALYWALETCAVPCTVTRRFQTFTPLSASLGTVSYPNRALSTLTSSWSPTKPISGLNAVPLPRLRLVTRSSHRQWASRRMYSESGLRNRFPVRQISYSADV